MLLWSLSAVHLGLTLARGDAPFLAAGALALCAAVTVTFAGSAGLPVAAWTDGLDHRRYGFGTARKAVAGILVRALPWPLFAWQLRDDPSQLPVLGDAALAAQSLLALVAVLVDVRHRSLARTLRLGLDAAITALGLTLAVWVLVVGPRVGFDAGRADVLFALAVCFVLFAQLALVALLIVREPVTHGVSAVLAVVALVVGEVGVVVTAFHGGRTLPWPVAAVWAVGWLLMTWSILVNRQLPVEQVPAEVAERREIASTDLTAGAVAVSVVVSVVGYLLRDHARPPGLTPYAVVVLLAVLVFAARESLLGRARARLTTQLRRQAQLDPLTGLANRRGLTERLRRISPDDEWSVLALDLDGFKAVNDVHGHAAGDDVLVVVADVLRALGPPDGVAARTGGDEFAVLMRGDVTTGRALGVQVAAAVREQLAVLGLGPRITVSVGVGRVGPGHVGENAARVAGLSADTGRDRLVAVVEAAAALRAAKDLGRDRVQVYPGLVARQRERRLLLEARLREALRTGGVTAVGQPVVDLRTGATVGVEALARWHDEELGHVPPAEFVLVAERSGLVADLGRSVLRSAVEQYRAQGLVGSGVRLAVNVSPLELRGPGYVEGVAALLDATGVPGRDLVVEVTEAVVIEPGDPSVRVLSRLNDLGVQVAIDDFGTGYSALGYLRRLPVQVLKVDRSLVSEALSSVRTREIVAGVVDLARRLGLVVTLEGIEDDATARLARELGADLGQGYWFSPPVPWSQVAGAAWPGRPDAVAG